MRDFIRIGGEVVSQPLNENFRRLLNQISISNTNLIFPDENSTVDTIADMEAIESPVNAQCCYVISSGELYRYNRADKKWYKIADFGQTFRQGFLNSGAVLLEDYITLKEGTTTVLNIPKMLVYYKNKEGDKKYLKGMYLIDAQEVDIAPQINKACAYSLMIESNGVISTIQGLPKTDNPNKVFLGTVITNDDNEIMADFVYTLPDIAYTADRGNFLLNGGQASGMNLSAVAEGDEVKFIRNAGYYYDEGINFAQRPITDFPAGVDNGSNYDLKSFDVQDPAGSFIYMTPEGDFVNLETPSQTLIYDKYWDGTELADVPYGCFTIQQHLITPTGQNLIIYGSAYYNSMTDAMAHVNATYGLNIEFPCVEVTRVILGNLPAVFSPTDENTCQFHTLTRLAQIGTFTPKFSDNAFELYSGDADDTTPVRLQFNLKDLQEGDFNDYYYLNILPYQTERKLFSLDKKFINGEDGVDILINPTEEKERTYGGKGGYQLADQIDLDYLSNRVADIEAEIWTSKKDDVERYEQSVRYRLLEAENRLEQHDTQFENQSKAIEDLDEQKVDKTTKVNNHELKTDVTLVTDDIAEGTREGETGEPTNLWFKQERVKENEWVIEAKEHVDTISNPDASGAPGYVKINPHKLNTDDLYILSDSDRQFVTREESTKIDNLPTNTKEELTLLDTNKLDTIRVSLYTKGTETSEDLGEFKTIKLIKEGVEASIDTTKQELTLECLGQADASIVMYKNRYAKGEQTNPGLIGYEGDEPIPYVDNAAHAQDAERVYGYQTAGPGQYYGTNFFGEKKDENDNVIETVDKEIGWFDLPIGVTTEAYEGGPIQVDQVIIKPDPGSVGDSELEEALKLKIDNNYHTIKAGETEINEINKFYFGDGLTAIQSDIDPHAILITAETVAEGETPIHKFANLTDVNVSYKDNEGKMLVVNEDGTGIELSNTPSLKDYMLKAAYISEEDEFAVKKAIKAKEADKATTATNAGAVNEKSVDDSDTTTSSIWTAAKIIDYTNNQIQTVGVNTYSGTEVPTSDIGKDGDIFILTE